MSLLYEIGIDRMMNEYANRNFHQQSLSPRGRIKHAGNVRRLKQHQRYRKQMKLQRRKR